MAPLLGEWLKPLSNFKHQKPPTQAHWPGHLQELKCNQSAYEAMCSGMRKSECMRPVLHHRVPKCYASSLPLMNSLGNTWARSVPDAACAINTMHHAFHLGPLHHRTDKWLRTHYISTDLLTELSVCSTTPKRKGPHTAGSLFFTRALECAKPH